MRRCRSRACGASGASTAAALRDFSVVTIGDLAALDRSALVRRFGKHGASLVDRAHGVDPDPVDDPDAAKSVSHEMTFDEDTADIEVLERTLLAMSEGVSGRLRHAGLKAGTVTVKIRDSGFNTITRQRGLRRAVRHDRADLAGRARAGAAGDARASGSGCSAWRRRRSGRASSSGCSRSEDARRRRVDRGGGRGARAVRDAGDHAGAAAADRHPGAVRARLRDRRSSVAATSPRTSTRTGRKRPQAP